jgi:hypothetical protein
MLQDTNTSTDIAKDSKIGSHIQKNNHLMLGFISWHELFDKIIGIKQSVFNFFIAMAAITTTFINNYVWDDAKAIYFMLFLISFDAATGIYKSIKNKTFSSSRLPRILVIMVIYTTLLAISWNISKFSPFYYWLPGALYGGFIATLIVSIFENLHELKMIPDRVYTLVKTKLEALQTLILGATKKDDKKKKK